jgi:hypothetical protein
MRHIEDFTLLLREALAEVEAALQTTAREKLGRCLDEVAIVWPKFHARRW